MFGINKTARNRTVRGGRLWKDKLRRMTVMGPIAVAIGLAAGLAVIFAMEEFLATSNAVRPPPAASKAVTGSADTRHAKVEISEEARDLGTMQVSEERTAEFFLRNTGGEPLQISQVQTSCMCTFAQVMIDDEQSPLFNMEMHNPPDVQTWKGIVEPGATAAVRVVYKPSLMPVEGAVARYVKFGTNDPSRPVVELSVHATVQ